MKNINIPVGISDFREIKEGNYYYIDKTGLIEEILRTPGNKGDIIYPTPPFRKNTGNEYACTLF